MHYIPESACELLRSDPLRDDTARDFHARTAPLYALTLLVAALLLIDVALQSGWLPEWSAWKEVYGYRWALFAALVGGARILYHTLDGLASGRVGADLALTVACLAAIILGEHQTAALVVLISLIGESLEGYTVDRARAAVERGFALQPRTAHLLGEQGERDVPLSDLRVGDVVVIRPGERVPVDGTVVAGQSTIDESAFTGEAVPVSKGEGKAVLAGTLNQFGALQVRAERIGAETSLAAVADLVAEATRKKAPGERIADRMARWFLPAVLAAALLTLIGWRIATGSWRPGVLPALAVLVVACPCPLVLATPCAVLAALAWLGRRGVIVKGSATLERLAQVDTVAFDKTGTLTQGALTLGEIVPCSGYTQDDVLRLAAMAERRSEHVVSRAIVRAADERHLSTPSPYDFTAIPGEGVQATIRTKLLAGIAPLETAATNEVCVRVGRCEWLQAAGVEVPAALQERGEELAARGQTLLMVSVEDRACGVIGVCDTVRAESRAILDALRGLGWQRMALLTGDRAAVVQGVAAKLGSFEQIASEQSPAAKTAWINAQRQAGRVVAMVGDGVNDAPALAAADVGLAISRPGSDLAAAAGDVLLLGEPLRVLPGLVRLSRALVDNIRQSILLFAVGVNGLGVLGSSVGWLDPVAAAIFHEFASLAVMLNAMRLLWFQGDAPTATASAWSPDLDVVAAWLSPSRWIEQFLARWSLWVRVVPALLVLGWLCSQVVWIKADQQAVVRRFGRTHAVLSAGLHWRWPQPFETVDVRRPWALETVLLGGREEPSRSNAIEWTSDHNRPRDGVETDFLTADEVLVDITAALQYRIADLRVAALQDPVVVTESLRFVLQGVLRELTARYRLDDWLTDRRSELEQQAQALLRKRVAALPLGVELVDLQLLEIHPPTLVVPAYRDVADALEEQERSRNEAQTSAARTLIDAVGEPVAAQLLAKSVKNDDADLSDEDWAGLIRPAEGSMLLSGASAAELETAAADAIKQSATAAAQAARLEALRDVWRRDPALTWSTIYWRELAAVLQSRSLTLIDPQAAGRQQWWLTEPPGRAGGRESPR